MRETDLLDGYLAAEREKPFAWGVGNGDCLLFVAGWGLVLNGVDFAAHLRGTYSDEAGARAAIETEGGAISYFDKVAGQRRQGGSFFRGDIGLVSFNGWHLGMICTGSLWVAKTGEGGLRYLRRPADIAWAPNPARLGAFY
ncbi:DUF6950 family protein [Neorhizobium lilium]|uniref:DUF6950 family protein n=1 Tax=Neorhizobium lilium TaxID=2503024 RepID=UPI0026CD7BFA